MKCSNAHKLISPYIDGELSVLEKEELESHLKQCGICSRELYELQENHRVFAETERFRAPSDFSKKVMARLEPVPPKLFFFRPLFINFAEAFAMLLIIGIGILSGSFLSNTMGFHKPGNNVALLSLDVFDATPPDSLAGVYLAMTERRYEK